MEASPYSVDCDPIALTAAFFKVTGTTIKAKVGLLFGAELNENLCATVPSRTLFGFIQNDVADRGTQFLHKQKGFYSLKKKNSKESSKKTLQMQRGRDSTPPLLVIPHREYG